MIPRASAHVRTTLAQAEAVAVGAPDARAVVILLSPGSLTVVGDLADRAMLPAELREAIEAALRGPAPRDL